MVSAAVQRELFQRRRNLTEYINTDPITVIFTRYPRVDDGAGGWIKGTPTYTEPQIMRLVPYKRRLSALTVHTTYGDIPDVQYSLVAQYNADCERWDEFSVNGQDYKVVGKEPKTEYADSADRLTILIDLRDGPI